MSETTIGGAHAAAPTLSEDQTPREPTSYDDAAETALTEQAKTLDLEAWIQGATGVKRACTVYSNLAVTAKIDVLRTRLEEAQKLRLSVDVVRKIREDIANLTRVQAESSLDIVIEGVAPEVYLKRQEKIASYLGRDGQPLDSIHQTYHLIAERVVSPQGVTPRWLEQMHTALPGEFTKVASCFKQTLENSGVVFNQVTAPLSRGV